ncbi:O-antigen ligase family protein [Psychroserpens sp.]|uniref:O-antigen ligase family protein n=1 Tax=Psychroserpens sp. TaxID=2020870 RepID=UPI00385A9CA3
MKSVVFIIIAFLLATNNVFIDFRVGSLSIDRLLEFLFFGLFLNTFIKEFFANAFFKKFTLFVVSLAIVQLISNALLASFHGLESMILLEDLFKSLSFIAYSFLFYLIVKEDLWYLKFIVFIHLLICLFALLQHPLSPLSSEIHDIKLQLYSNIDQEDARSIKLKNQETHIDFGVSNKFRLSGPFVSTTTFSYFLMVTFLFNLYLYFRTHKRIYVFTTAFVILCSILTQTRSLVIAIAIILIGIFILINNYSRFNNLKVISTVILLVTSLVFMNKFDSFFDENTTRLTNLTENPTSTGRPLLWLAGLKAVAKHPLGITDAQYNTVKQDMSKQYGKNGLGYLNSHNGLINIGINYSAIGYFIIFMFSLFILKYTRLLSKNFKSLFYLFFIGYLINIFFHNNFIFISDYDILMALMLIPLQYIYEQEQLNETKTNELI